MSGGRISTSYLHKDKSHVLIKKKIAFSLSENYPLYILHFIVMEYGELTLTHFYFKSIISLIMIIKTF